MLKVSYFALAFAALTLFGADKKHKGPDVEITQISVKRLEGLVNIDVSLRNTGEKPLLGATLVFHFFGAEHAPLTTQKAAVEEDNLAPGGEASIHAQLNDPVRAVEMDIAAVDERGRDLKVAKPGPYPIE